MTSRTTLRDIIFRILFRVEFNSLEEMDEQISFALNELGDLSEEDEDFNKGKRLEQLPPEDEQYVIDKVKAILARIDDIDGYISEISDGWHINRLGKTELAILRLAVYEIKYDDSIPFGVAVNEALELSKKYCKEDAKNFINAILDKLKDNEDV